MQSLGDHRVLIPGDVRGAGAAKVEDAGQVRSDATAAEIALHEAAKISCERDTEIAGTLTGAPMRFRFECNLGACHHDGTIVAQ